ncbi:acyltransferase [Peribacillus psychrosaccharolyticus]|uniref:acyltransferase n=1 Tax=Peribacillus psychrosaccharolyticus TaxID=1407 RepID=UPI00030D1C6A|nr:acyltransferase [Peribacillus psychrosaccharolyticus]MEC2054484.1 acyltransferase [Peribacillus psychrosaccharolyticus]MED3744289.1 acyltransferase [Peribacillus psychrosaccharolyticus]
MRKIKLFQLMFFSNIKLMFIKFLNLNSVSYNYLSFINPKLKINIIGKRAKLTIGKKARIESGGSLRVSNGYISLGDFVDFKENTVIEANKGTVKIGNSVFLNRNCSIISCERIEIGEGTSLGANVLIYDHDHIYVREGSQPWNEIKSSPVIIGKNVWIGANTVILRGTKIGDNAVIAAGSVIKGEIPSHTLAYQERNTVFKEIS